MPTFVSIRPDSLAFQNGLRSQMNAEDALNFEGCELDDLRLCPDDNSLQVTLRMARVAEERGPFDALRKYFGEQGASHILLKVGYLPGTLTPQEYLALHFHDLAGWMQQDLELDQAWMGGLDYEFEEGSGHLQLVFGSLLAERALRERKAPAWLSGQLKWACGEGVEVTLRHDQSLAAAPAAKEAQETPAQAAGASTPSIKASNAKPPAPAVKEHVLVGRSIPAEKVKTMVSLQEEEGSVVVEGDCFALSSDLKKTGRTLVKLAVSDGTDSIGAKFWLEPKAPLPKGLDKGARLRLRGDLKPDTYENNELTLEVRDVMRLPNRARRQDLAASKRVELHAHTKLSALDGLTDIEAYMERAAEWGHPAVGITDHGVVHAFPLAYKALKGLNKKREKDGLAPVKLLLGMEAYLVEDASFLEVKPGEKIQAPEYFHAILYARNPAGRRALYELVTHSHTRAYYKKPLIARALLAEKRADLLLGSACEQGELMQAIFKGAGDGELEAIAGFYDYLEVQPIANNAFMVRNSLVPDEEALKAMVRKVIALGEKLGKPVVATSDMHFLDPEDQLFRRVLQAGQKFSDVTQPPLYFHTTEEMKAEFEWLADEALLERIVVEAPQAVAALCEDMPPVPDGRFFPELAGAEESVQEKAWARAKEVYGEPVPELVEARLKRELQTITANKFAVLYEIARQLVEASVAKGYSVGSRGSVGSSLAAYLLRITEVNPLAAQERCPQCRYIEFHEKQRLAGVDLVPRDCPKCGTRLVRDGYNIPFETFVGFKGDKVPDIDLNFAPEVQGEIQKHAETLFGEGRAFKAGTISTLADKNAFGFVKKYLEGIGESRRKVEIERMKDGLVGVKRTSGQHPGGVILVRHDNDINEFTPVQYSGDLNEQGGREKATAGQLFTTHFDYHAIDENLVKLDILGKDDGSAFKHLQDLTGLHESLVPLDDPAALSIFSSHKELKFPKLNGEERETFGETGAIAIPEFGTSNTRRMLELTRPQNFTELIYISGLSHGTGVWASNAEDLIKAGIATLDTVISTRDDIMNRLIQQGMEPGEAFKITEKVRKGAVAKEGFTPEDEKALKDAKLPTWWIESCRKIQYMFPKAHATAYCFTAVRMAYFKVHHPAAFYAAWLTLHAQDADGESLAAGREATLDRIRKLRQLVTDKTATAKDHGALGALVVGLEALLRGITFKKVDLYKSDPYRFTLVGDNALLLPLVSLPGLGDTAALHLDEERKLGPFKSIEDLAGRAGLNKTVIEKLQGSGALDILPKANQIDLF